MVTIHDPSWVYVAIDTETTGLNSSVHEICQIGAVCRQADLPDETWDTLVSGRFAVVNEQAIALNHIDLDQARRGPSLTMAVEQLLQWISETAHDRPVIILIHNAPFDLAFLPPITWPGPVLDTSALARALLHVDESLSRLLERYGIGRRGAAHSAVSDAQAVLDLWEQVLRPMLLSHATIEDVQAMIAAAPPSRRYQQF
ncbi:DNA polymerase III PolC [Sulfobacillus acidophilus TPY]|uniref:RNAse T n=1 Tax=Sulfobacillus acidophilus (strain ATCC 700253 / DSM 10332 / NAL) TaxID=679936 RepID=G8TUK1_SULAD|nr:DNA polymerase III PolC [Sulfobacillus acidophilus TPY]AEW04648.1 RNAse T [Sulfobacillus acidophilus DSM 10332]